MTKKPFNNVPANIGWLGLIWNLLRWWPSMFWWMNFRHDQEMGELKGFKKYRNPWSKQNRRSGHRVGTIGPVFKRPRVSFHYLESSNESKKEWPHTMIDRSLVIHKIYPDDDALHIDLISSPYVKGVDDLNYVRAPYPGPW